MIEHARVRRAKYPDYPPTEPERTEEVGGLRRKHWNWRKHEPLAWQGHVIRKPEEDLLRYQEIIFETRPQVIVETGGAFGGSAHFFRDMMTICGIRPWVVSVSLEWYVDEPEPTEWWVPITGDSTEESTARMVEMAVGDRSCLVSLDGDHSTSAVLDELELYSPLIRPGHFLVVEDTTVEDVPSHSHVLHGCGPREALVRWLPLNPDFEVVRKSEPRFLTCNYGGWLRRKP